MNFHVASRGRGGGGVIINFGFPAGGSCLNCSNKKNFSLARFLENTFFIT